MKTVIGLFWEDENVNSSIHKLKRAGFAEDMISVLTRDSKVRKLLNCAGGRVLAKCVGFGAFLGSVTYGVFGLSVGMGSCTLFDDGLASGIVRLIPFLVIGAVFGASMGCFAGIGEAEKGTHLYCQGVRMGAKVVAVKTSDELIAKAVGILCHENAIGVTTLKDTQGGSLSP